MNDTEENKPPSENETLSVGDKIQLDPKIRKAVSEAWDNRKNAAAAFSEASKLIREREELLWQMIREVHPELKNVEFRFEIETQTMTVMRVRK